MAGCERSSAANDPVPAPGEAVIASGPGGSGADRDEAATDPAITTASRHDSAMDEPPPATVPATLDAPAVDDGRRAGHAPPTETAVLEATPESVIPHQVRADPPAVSSDRRSTSGYRPPPGALDQPFDAGTLVALRATVAAHGAEYGLTGQLLADLVLVAHELASNAVNHGGDRGRLRLWCDDRYVHCRVLDHGHWQTDPARLGHDRPPVGATRGRGLWLVRQLAAYLDVETGTDGTSVTAGLIIDGRPGTVIDEAP